MSGGAGASSPAPQRLDPRPLWPRDQLVLYGLAAAAGAAASLGAIAFRWLIDVVQWLAFGQGGDNLATPAAALPWWHVVLAPTLGGLVVGLFIRYCMPERRPHGVPEVIEAAAFKSGRLHLTHGLLAAAASGVSLGVGASAGREGPVVHLGAAIASWVARRLHLTRARMLTLLGCGVASAIAASFNAPIAGVFFALEVVVGHFAVGAFAPVVVAAVIGTLIARAHFGDFPAFIVPRAIEVQAWEFPIFALVGFAGAGAAILLMRSIMAAQDAMGRLPGPVWCRPALGGLLVGLIATAFPQVLGVGYEVTDLALRDQLGLSLLLAVFVAKIVATALSLGAGFSGGMFSPSLVVGAMLGAALGAVAAEIWPSAASSGGAYAMVGMGAVAAPVLGAPLSTVLMIFELTADYKITIAVMLAVAISTLLVKQALGHSFFTWALERRGVVLVEAGESRMLRAARVSELLRRDVTRIRPDDHPAALRRALIGAPHGVLFVIGEGEKLIGAVTVAELSESLVDSTLDPLIRAEDIARRLPLSLDASESLASALERSKGLGEPFIPVVEGTDETFVGIVLERDLLLRHQMALVQARAEERGEV